MFLRKDFIEAQRKELEELGIDGILKRLAEMDETFMEKIIEQFVTYVVTKEMCEKWIEEDP